MSKFRASKLKRCSFISYKWEGLNKINLNKNMTCFSTHQFEPGLSSEELDAAKNRSVKWHSGDGMEGDRSIFDQMLNSIEGARQEEAVKEEDPRRTQIYQAYGKKSYEDFVRFKDYRKKSIYDDSRNSGGCDYCHGACLCVAGSSSTAPEQKGKGKKRKRWGDPEESKMSMADMEQAAVALAPIVGPKRSVRRKTK